MRYAVTGVLALIWLAGVIVALPGLVIMGASARLGLWLSEPEL